jgi:hypothetical protein
MPEKCIPVDNGHLCGHAEGFDAPLQVADGRPVLLDEDNPMGPAAEGFQSQGAGSGEQVDGEFAFDVRPETVEQGLADAVFHGPGARITAIMELVAAETAGDDSYADRRLSWGKCHNPYTR